MNYQGIQYFIKAAEYNHFSKAAESLFISQSALSKAISNLEEELGVPLFHREGKGVDLTTYGKAFYSFAQRAMQELQNGQETVQSMYQLNCGQLRIGAIQNMCAEFLPERLWGFQGQNPKISLSVQYALSSEIFRGVWERQLHLGICGNFEANNPKYAGVSRALLRQEETVLVVSSRHRLAGREKVSIEELREEEFIVYKWNDLSIDLTLNNACQMAGFSPRIKTNAYNEINILGKVAAGEGIAMMAGYFPISFPNVKRLQFDGPPVRNNIYLIWIEEDIAHSPAAQKFKEYMVSHREDPAPHASDEIIS